jgi:hypothetical protein
MQNTALQILKALALLFFTLLIFGCVSHKKQNKTANHFNEISFGSGGGFTGFTNEYLLKNNGEVFKIGSQNQTQINQIPTTQIKDIATLIKEIDFQSLQISETGNITYFIEVRTTTYTHKVSWTDGSNSTNLKAFYKKLIHTLK